MHPNPAFRGAVDDPLALAEAIGFAHLFAATPDGPMVAHVAVTHHGDALRFHLARANRIAGHLDGAAILLSLSPVNGYVSPSWYDQKRNVVPTWNYIALEIDGIAAVTDEAALIDQLDRLAAVNEPRVGTAPPWTRATMEPDAFAAMLTAIVAFDVRVTGFRETHKLNQNKTEADRAGVTAGLRRSGQAAMAAAMRGTA